MAAPSPHNLDLFHLQVYDYFVWLTKQRTSAATGRLRGQRLGESIVAAMEEEFPELVSHSVNMERTPFLLLAVQHYSRQWHQQVVRSTTATATSTGTNGTSTAAADGPEQQHQGRKRSRKSMEDTAAAGSTGTMTTHPSALVLSPASKKLGGWDETVLIRERPRRACRSSSPNTKSPPKSWSDHYREAVDFCTRYPAIKYITRESNPTLHHWLEEQNTQLSLQPEFDSAKKKQLEQLHLENLAALKQPTQLVTPGTATVAPRSKSLADPHSTKFTGTTGTTAASTTTTTTTNESNAVWLQKFDKVQRLEAQGRPLTEPLQRWIEENRAAIAAAGNQGNTTSNTKDFAAWKHKLNLLKTLQAWNTSVPSTTAAVTADPLSKTKSKPVDQGDRTNNATIRTTAATHHAILDTPSTTSTNTSGAASKKKTRTSSSSFSTSSPWTPNDTTIPRKVNTTSSASVYINSSLPQSDTKKTTRSSVAATAANNSSQTLKTPPTSLVDTPDAPKQGGIKTIARNSVVYKPNKNSSTQPTATTTTSTTTPTSSRKDAPQPAPSTTSVSANVSQKGPTNTFNMFSTTRTVGSIGGSTNTGNIPQSQATTSTMVSSKFAPMQSTLQSQPSTQPVGNKFLPHMGGATTSLAGNGGQAQQPNVPVNNFAQAPAATANFQRFPSSQVMPMDQMMRSNLPYNNNGNNHGTNMNNNMSQPMPQQQQQQQLPMQGAVVNPQMQQLAWQQQQQQQQQQHQRYLQQKWQQGAHQQAGPWNNHHGHGGK